MTASRSSVSGTCPALLIYAGESPTGHCLDIREDMKSHCCQSAKEIKTSTSIACAKPGRRTAIRVFAELV
ncbi:hypothetical protein AGOR_G00077250 [Albula goreensis]|uniref:Uncharacterized protein n=1 Tax=Albula goreensis TaxID=1534307 RepID=A0A8T3DN53_9TELE|nr:hypothetical protein AGOR_G00077250 [Albula goreensis]